MRLFRIFQPDTPPDRTAIVERQSQEILEQLKALRGELAEVRRRESQLRAVLQGDAALEASQRNLEKVLAHDDIASHITAAIRRAEFFDTPFPYTVIDNVLPADLYRCVIRGIPPLEVFS